MIQKQISSRLLGCMLLLMIVLGSAQQARAWGFWAHQRINRLAVFTLPPEMLVLYKKNIEYITKHAVDPDKRRYAVDYEAPRHYIDVDHYGEYPFENVPRRWNDAVDVLTRDTLEAYGIVPWHIQVTYYKLVKAFKAGDLEKVMKESAEIGHYIGDANVPLHTTENYNGQLTGQKGIHGLWESRLPEIFGNDYNYFVGKARYIDNVLEEAWDMVLESHIALDSVFGFEKKLTESLGSDRKYSFETRGSATVKTYSREFCTGYHNMLAGMVERRARASIIRVGSIWYTAWVDAGQPDLKAMMDNVIPEQKIEYEDGHNKTIKDKNGNKVKDRESGDLGALSDPWEMLFGSCDGHSMSAGHVHRKPVESRSTALRQSIGDRPVLSLAKGR